MWICRWFGHRFEARHNTVGEVSAYIGDVCKRCGQPRADHLSAPQKSLGDAYAIVHREGYAPVTVALYEINVDFRRFEGAAFTLKGHQA